MKEIKTLRKILKIFNLIPINQKLNFYFLCIFAFSSSILEVFSVYLVIPVYKVLIDNEKLSNVIPWIHSTLSLNFDSAKQEQIFALACFALIFTISNTLKTYITWQAGKQTGNIGAFLFSYSYSKVISQPYQSLSSDNLSRYSSNYLTTNSYFVAVLKNIVLFVGYLSTTIIIFFTLFFLNKTATTFGIIFLIVPYLLVTKITNPIGYKVSQQIAFLHEDINRYIQEGFKSLKTIIHFQAQKYYTNNFYKREIKLRQKIALGEFLETFPRFSLEGLGLIMITILYGSSIFINGVNISTEFIITLIFACQKILPCLQQIYRIWIYIINFSSSVDDLYKNIFFTEKIIPKIKYKDNYISFKNVYFSYNKDKNYSRIKSKNYILENINLQLNFPGSISISGNSGCGKTTFVDLLTGLLSPDKGTILLPEELKNSKNIGYVPQEVTIINGTFLDNICLGNEDIKKNKDLIIKCLEIVELNKFIKNLHFGLETILGEQAMNLSGGQKQRLGIARALVTQPNLLVLDESTNALDGKSKKRILNNLLKTFSDSLIIFITHDRELIRNFQTNLEFDKNGKLNIL